MIESKSDEVTTGILVYTGNVFQMKLPIIRKIWTLYLSQEQSKHPRDISMINDAHKASFLNNDHHFRPRIDSFGVEHKIEDLVNIIQDLYESNKGKMPTRQLHLEILKKYHIDIPKSTLNEILIEFHFRFYKSYISVYLKDSHFVDRVKFVLDRIDFSRNIIIDGKIYYYFKDISNYIYIGIKSLDIFLISYHYLFFIVVAIINLLAVVLVIVVLVIIIILY